MWWWFGLVVSFAAGFAFGYFAQPIRMALYYLKHGSPLG